MYFSNLFTPLAWILEKTKVRKIKRKKERSRKIKPINVPQTMMIAIWWKMRSQGCGKELKGGRFVFIEGID
jgi:hypothetical protein